MGSINGGISLDELTADAVEYDNGLSGLTATNVQDAIDEISTTVGVSASPGFTWGRSGNIVSGTWLNNDEVPSNKAGRTVALTSPIITQVFVANEDVNTFDIGLYEHQGNEVGLTLLGTVSVVAARSAVFTVSISATSGRQLATRISSGTAKNLVIGVQLKGSV